MEFKKCLRCGCFFSSSNNICLNCESKDKADLAKLDNFINQDIPFNSLYDVSFNTGITIKNLNRFIENKDIGGLDIRF